MDNLNRSRAYTLIIACTLVVVPVHGYAATTASTHAALLAPLKAFATTAAETRVPFRVDRGVIVFQARINGEGPFDFAFDPGAQGVLTSVAASPLGLKSGSTATIRSLRIGSAELQNVPLPVYAGDAADIFRTSPNEPGI